MSEEHRAGSEEPKGPEPPNLWRVARLINLIAGALILLWLLIAVVSRLSGR